MPEPKDGFHPQDDHDIDWYKTAVEALSVVINALPDEQRNSLLDAYHEEFIRRVETAKAGSAS